MIKGLELFAGIGGWKQALNNIRLNVFILPVEIDKNTMETYNIIHNSEWKNSDIKHFIPYANNYDVIFMSPPCQNYSKAKKCAKRVFDNLISYTLPIIEKCMPRYVILENVPQFEKSKDYQNFREKMYMDLNYAAHENILNPIDYNWPQNRPRFFAIWFRDYRDCEKFKWPEKEKLTLSVANIIKNIPYEFNKWKTIPENAKISKTGNSIYWGKYIDNRCFKWNSFIGTITTFNQPMISSDTNYLYRKLTVAECFALMGFPYEIFLKIKKALPKISNSSLKRMAGNSIVLPLIEKILKNLNWE